MSTPFMRCYLAALAVLMMTVPCELAAGQDRLSSPPAARPDTSYGEAAYDVEMLGLDGAMKSLADYRGTVLFINFWATWCAPCIAELPSIEALSRRVGSAPVAVLMISVDDDLDDVRQFIQEQDIDGEVFLRMWAAGESTFRRAVIPTTYVISKSGKITYRHSGAAKWDTDEFANYLRGLTEE